MKRALFVCLLSLITFTSNAQINQVARVEIRLKLLQRNVWSFYNEGSYLTAGFGSKGILAYRHVTEIESDKSEIQLIKYDTALHEDWKGYLPVNRNLDIRLVDYNDDKVYFLLKHRDLEVADFALISVAADGTYDVVQINNVIPVEPSHLIMTQEAAFIGGDVKGTPIILFYDLKKRVTHVLPGVFQEPGKLNQLSGNPDGTIDVVLQVVGPEKKQAIYLKNYSAAGELLQSVLVQSSDDKFLQVARSTRTSGGHQILAGIYGSSSFSHGIFIADIAKGEVNTLRYYNFSELRNFFSFKGFRKQARIKDQIAKKTGEGKKVEFDYHFYMTDIIPYRDQFVIKAEAYKPLNTTSSAEYLKQGKSVPFKYSHAVLIAFNSNGVILWDNSFEINDVQSSTLRELVKVVPGDDDIYLLHPYRGSFTYEVIRDSEVMEGKAKAKVKSAASVDREVPNTTEYEQIEPWFGNCFFVSGTRQIFRKKEGNRRVFYINKVMIH